MQKRLISQNLLQCTNQSSPQFSAHGSLIAYRTQSSIKIKSFNKQISQLQLKIPKPVHTHFFTSHRQHLYCCIQYHDHNVEIYELELVGTAFKCKLYKQMSKCKNMVALKHGIAYVSQNNIVKLITLQNNNQIAICQCSPNTTILQHQGDDIFLVSSIEQANNNPARIVKIYHPSLNGCIYEQSALGIDYILQPLAMYRDQYVFNLVKERKEIQIYNIAISKLIGKITYEGQLVHSIVKENLFLTITNKDNIDKYCFYTLTTDTNAKNLLSHRCQYQKGKGMYYQVFSCSQQVSEKIIQGKSTSIVYDEPKNQSISSIDQSVLMMYVLPIKKTKIEIIKISRSKIKQQVFKQSEVDIYILSKADTKQKIISRKKIKTQAQQLQIQKVRITAAINHKKNEKSSEEVQKKFVDHLVDIKIKGLIDKFDQFQKRLSKIQNQITNIYQKIQKSLQNINKEQIKRNVQHLFQRVTPQFQSYFKQVFRQISGVLDQGVNYYKSKLSKQQKIHRQTFQQILNIAFKTTEQIVELGRKQLVNNQQKQENIYQLISIKKKWKSEIQQLSSAFIVNPKNQNNSPPTHYINLSTSPTQEKQKQQYERKKKKN